MESIGDEKEFSAMGFFTVSRTIIITILSTVVNYFFVLLGLK